MCLVSCCKRTSDAIGFRLHEGDLNSIRLFATSSSPFFKPDVGSVQFLTFRRDFPVVLYRIIKYKQNIVKHNSNNDR